MAKKKVNVLQVTAKRAGFRRAGLSFGQETQTIPVDTLKREQIAALKAEPMLVVVEGTVDVETEAAE